MADSRPDQGRSTLPRRTSHTSPHLRICVAAVRRSPRGTVPRGTPHRTSHDRRSCLEPGEPPTHRVLPRWSKALHQPRMHQASLTGKSPSATDTDTGDPSAPPLNSTAPPSRVPARSASTGLRPPGMGDRPPAPWTLTGWTTPGAHDEGTGTAPPSSSPRTPSNLELPRHGTHDVSTTATALSHARTGPPDPHRCDDHLAVHRREERSRRTGPCGLHRWVAETASQTGNRATDARERYIR